MSRHERDSPLPRNVFPGYTNYHVKPLIALVDIKYSRPREAFNPNQDQIGKLREFAGQMCAEIGPNRPGLFEVRPAAPTVYLLEEL